MTETILSAAVGAAAPNRPLDVAIVQTLLNRAEIGPAMPVDGVAGPLLLSRIALMQSVRMQLRYADQRIDPHGPTLAALDALARQQPDAPALDRRVSEGVLHGLDSAKFKRGYHRQFGGGAGLDRFLALLRADAAITDLRWGAYMLATAWWETAATFEPVEESGRGAHHPYGKPAPYTDSAGRDYANAYYGRGYVQITWLANYLALGKALGLGDQLAIAPERALQPEIAYRILSYGLRHGAFCGGRHTLGGYIHGADCDYVNARRLVNALDQAELIAERAAVMEELLRVACA